MRTARFEVLFDGDKTKAKMHYELMVAKLSDMAKLTVPGLGLDRYLANGTITDTDGATLSGPAFDALKLELEVMIYEEVMASISHAATKARFAAEFGADPSSPRGSLALKEFKNMATRRRLSFDDGMHAAAAAAAHAWHDVQHAAPTSAQRHRWGENALKVLDAVGCKVLEGFAMIGSAPIPGPVIPVGVLTGRRNSV